MGRMAVHPMPCTTNYETKYMIQSTYTCTTLTSYKKESILKDAISRLVKAAYARKRNAVKFTRKLQM